eukprot:CAMPEP_0181525868 /NCGR_PEP_ID=MMETSP1110-20121109/69189_1 /TAXON_ID=174948 /ORGANISM="Symbiodinium sp., Strain CCMP421" /LENGTH=123 /DNA_ID=CAMNT_0023656685 /DNA_START=284 /DNA_END=655 /DNA_ORIENTATION=+
MSSGLRSLLLHRPQDLRPHNEQVALLTLCGSCAVFGDEKHCAIVSMALVVSGRENTHEHTAVHDVKTTASLFGLMAADDQAKTISGAKGLSDVPGELSSDTSTRRRVDTESVGVCSCPIFDGV